MALKTVASIGAVVALLAASSAFADTAPKQAAPTAKQVSQIMNLQRSHLHGAGRDNHFAPGVPLIVAGVAVVGAGTYFATTSN